VWYTLVELTKTEKDEVSAQVTTKPGSPWFSGHFPDNPILPGIAQLDMVADCIAAAWENMVTMTGVSRIKFRKIVRPGEPLDIRATWDKKKGQYAFQVTSRDEDVCSGIMRFVRKQQV
jgi:3-hydroxymyristoyl/3-hydroxydecanoyl-(acyl carrier protein) dehydratase